MLNEQQISKELLQIMEGVDAGNNSDKSVEDTQKDYSDAIAKWLVATLNKATVTIPIGAIQVQGSAVAQANVAPIILKAAIS